ncbi:MAG: indolepyruvate oxidoreductase subunit beta [candidate division WOR-3 bacterium]|nr:indolepyruvate oxidoreductase subunit beta [candidate division WOR-3 bacterium]
MMDKRKKEDKITNIIICGVGGQGILLASDILCTAAFLTGYDVKKSEIHGMAQRGGSVITHVRFGRKIYSPLVEEGNADFILAFEKLEALRYSYFLKKDCRIIVNDLQLPPLSVLTGEKEYPDNVIKILKTLGKVDVIQAHDIALRLGNVRVTNVVLLGSLSRYLNFPENIWIDALKENVKPQYQDLNIKAFELGKAAV